MSDKTNGSSVSAHKTSDVYDSSQPIKPAPPAPAAAHTRTTYTYEFTTEPPAHGNGSHETVIMYDDSGRIICTFDPAGKVTTYTYSYKKPAAKHNRSSSQNPKAKKPKAAPKKRPARKNRPPRKK